MKDDLICWDSSVLISWLRGDEDADRNRATRAVVQHVESGTSRLVVSTLLYVEVLESRMPAGAIEQFKKFMQNRRMIEIIAVDIRVAEKAQAIRNISSRNLKTPDAVHIATAILSGAKLFHTFDEGLLRLGGTDDVDGLSITACEIPGMNLPLF